MDYIDTLRVFCTVAEVRSFTRAAQVLGMSTPAISRAVAELEQRLSVRLFQRSTRHISTTEVAERLFERSAKLLAELDTLEAEARQGVSDLSGVLRLVAHTTATHSLLLPLIMSFKRTFPTLHLDLTLTERPVDLVEEGYDLGILLPFMLTTDKTVTRLLRHIPVLLVTAPDYLQQFVFPRQPKDLREMKLVARSPSIEDPTLRFRCGDDVVTVDLKFEISTNNPMLRKELVVNGFGVGALPQMLIEQELKDGRLVQVIPDYELIDGSVELRLAYSNRKFVPAKVRAFVDYAIAFYENAPSQVQ
jgi:DNA-binding transcriptional LysR family regulator